VLRNCRTVRSCYSCSKPDKTVIYFKLLIIDGYGDRGIDTIINDDYAIPWEICFIGGGNRSVRWKHPICQKKMYKCYHIASSRVKPGTVEMKLTALITDFNQDCLHCSYHDPTVHTKVWKCEINTKKNGRNKQEWTIQRHWHLWAHKPQYKEKQTIQMLKHTNPKQTRSEPCMRSRIVNSSCLL
jgi:hypothetical protein